MLQKVRGADTCSPVKTVTGARHRWGLGPFSFLLLSSALACSGAFCRVRGVSEGSCLRGRNSTHGSSNKGGTLGSRDTERRGRAGSRPGCIVETPICPSLSHTPVPLPLQLAVLASLWKGLSTQWPRSSMLTLWLRDHSRKNVFYLPVPVRTMRGHRSVAPPAGALGDGHGGGAAPFG